MQVAQQTRAQIIAQPLVDFQRIEMLCAQHCELEIVNVAKRADREHGPVVW